MEADASVDQLKKGEILSREFLNKLEENRAVMEAKDAVQSSPRPLVLANGGASLGPSTPDSNKESGDLMSNFTSPLTIVSSPLRGFDSHSQLIGEPDCSDEDSPHTPKECIFNPFAPGPDKLMLAPNCTKYLEESRSYVARRLNLGSNMKIDGYAKRESDAEAISDDDDHLLLETVYGTLMEAIISKQTEAMLAEISSVDPCLDGFKTPSSVPLLNGIADTCPVAPMKPTKKSRSIDLGLCKRLEF